LPGSFASDPRRRAKTTITAIVIVGLLLVGLWAAALVSITVVAAPHEHARVVGAIAAATTLILLGLATSLLRGIRRQTVNEHALAEEHAKLEASNQRLREVQETLSDAVDSISEAFVIFDRDDKFIMCNEAYRRLYSAHEAALTPGQNYERLIRENAATGFYLSAVGREEEWVEERLEGHRNPSGAIEQPLFDGRVLLITERRMRDGGTAGLRIDITKMKEAEQRQKELEYQLLHSQKLEAVGTLAGGIAHELNNALQPILALSQMALRDLSPTSELREDIETINLASRRAQGLVQGILAFSRKQYTPKTKIDLARLVHRTLAMLRSTLPTTTRIEEVIAPIPPLLANADQLQQVIVNLVTNASHAIGTTFGTTLGTITIAVDSAPHEQVCEENGEEFIRVRIADTGCGMDAATIEHIFEPFYTTKEVGVGTGLGLSVVHGIITDHGGRIEVNSTPGKGTVFSIYLPLSAAPERLLETTA
jgi:two-component system cell cycle sensor histidine kinase/response regulator CckA